MGDIDLGALKFRVGIDDSEIDKQVKDIQKKLSDAFNQQVSFKPIVTEVGSINQKLSDTVDKLKEVDKISSDIGKSKSGKKMDILIQIESLSQRITEASREYERLDKTYRNLGNAGGDKGMSARKANLESQKAVINDLVEELNRLKTAYSLTASSVPKMSIADERELAFLRQQYELEIAKTNELDRQIVKREQMNKKMQSDNQRYLQYLSGQSGMAIGMPEGNVNDINKKIAAIQARLDSLNRFKANINISSNQALKADAVIAKLQAKLDRLSVSLRKSSTEELLKINPTSINQANSLIGELINRRNALNTTDANYERTLSTLNKRIQEHNNFVTSSTNHAVKLQETNQRNTSSSKEFTEELTKQNRVMREFVNTIKTYAGFYFFRDMFQELVNIRGEFELQQVSLRAIIQDARRADQIFSQIKGLAVISPFQFKDLVGYTKQLAAFQIPVNELYGTMKNLADISSGLGVDMGRIILAYGQIRSAGVLRGQELRQLTEAGIPALEALRKKLEEVKGTAQTTDDVFNDISNRKIPFEYVKEMFTTMTEDGGMFYKMQEIQASSLKGMVSNLADSYQIMMNTIGESNDSTLKAIVGGITDAMNNWRYFTKALEGVAIGYASLKALQLARIALLGKEVVETTNSLRAEKLKEAQLLRQQQIYRTLSEAEISKINNANKLSASEIVTAVNSGKITAELGKRILATNMLTQEERELLITGLNLNAVDAARMRNMTVSTMWMNRIKLATFGLRNAFRSLWLTISQNPFMIILTAAGLVAEVYHTLSARADEFNQKIKDSAKSFKESYSDLQKDLDKINFSKLSPEDLEKIDTKQLESYESSLTDILSKYGNIGQSIIQQSKDIENVIDKVVFLQKSISNVEAAYKLAAQESDLFLNADKASNSSNYFWKVNTTSNLLKGYEEQAVKLAAAGSHIEQFRGKIVDAAKDIMLIGNNTEKWNTELNKLITDGASAATIIEKIRSLSLETRSAGTFEIFKAKVGFDSEDLLKEFEKVKKGVSGKVAELSLSFNMFGRYVEKRMTDIFGYVDFKKLTDEQVYVLKAQVEEYASVNQLGENARRKLYELVKERWNIDMVLDDREVKEGLTGWKKSLDEITGKQWTITIKANDIKSMEDYLKEVKKEYKEAKESIGNLQDTIDGYVREGKVSKIGNEYKLTGIVGPNEVESIGKIVGEINAANESMDKATGSAKQFHLELEKQKKGSNRDPLADLWKNRLSLLDSAYSKFKDLSINIGKDEAKKQIEAIYGSQALKLGVNLVYDQQSIINNYKKASKELAKIVPQDATKNAQKAAELSSGIYIESAKKVMKTITDEFNRYKNKYDFYKDILGITGNSDLAVDLTVQYTGDSSNIAENFAAGIYNNVQSALSGMNLDLGISLVPDTNSFSSMNQYMNELQEKIKSDSNMGDENKKVLQQMIDAWRGYFGEMAKSYAKDIEEYGNYYDQVRIIREKYKESISRAEGMGNTSLADSLRNSEQMELLKLTEDYQNFYGAVGAMSIEAAEKISQQLKEMFALSFQQGNITAKKYQEEIKRVNDQLDKLYNRKSNTSVLIKDGIQASLQNKIDQANDNASAALVKEQMITAQISEERNKYNKALKEGNMEEMLASSAKIQQLETQKAETKEVKDTNVVISESAEKMKRLIADALNVADAIEKWGTIVSSTISSVGNMIDALGGDSSVFSDLSGAINDVVGGISSIAKGFEQGGIVGGAFATVSAVANIVTGFAKRHDNRLQKHIGDLQNETKRLTNIYNMLEKEFEHVTDPFTIKDTSQKQLQNLKDQLQLQKDMIQAEYDKKKTDWGKIEDYKAAVNELQSEIRYFTENLANDLYSIDLKGWADKFGDALIDAWSKGENAAEAYKKTVADVLKDVVKNWIQQQYIETALKRVQTTLFGADGLGGMFSDQALDEDEIKQLGALMSSLEQSMAQGSEAWNKFNEAFGGILSETNDNAEGLSNAIAGVDENTFNQALGYINGIRYEMTVQSNLLRQLVSLNGGATEIGGISTTAIQQSQIDILNQQLAVTTAIKTALLSVITISPTGGGSAMKVIIT